MTRPLLVFSLVHSPSPPWRQPLRARYRSVTVSSLTRTMAGAKMTPSLPGQHVFIMSSAPAFQNFAEFYPYYLSEHADRTCRRLHFFGTSLVLLLLLGFVTSQQVWLLWLLPLAGYGCAWLGHFMFEKNRPATFQHPFYSLCGDFVMYKDMLTGKIPF